MGKRLKNSGNRRKEEEKEFSWELPREFMAKLLYGWEKERYEKKRERR